MPVRCPGCKGLAYRHPSDQRLGVRNRCGLTRAEAFAKARWARDGWLLRAFGQRGIGGGRIIWRAVQHRSDPDVRAMGQQAWRGPWRPEGPPWWSYLYGPGLDDGPGPAGPGPAPPAKAGGPDEKNP